MRALISHRSRAVVTLSLRRHTLPKRKRVFAFSSFSSSLPVFSLPSRAWPRPIIKSVFNFQFDAIVTPLPSTTMSNIGSPRRKCAREQGGWNDTKTEKTREREPNERAARGCVSVREASPNVAYEMMTGGPPDADKDKKKRSREIKKQD